jgi:hypothetical protein
MQAELAVEAPGAAIQLAAINEIGHDGGLATMSDLGDLPLLQDTDEETVWDDWDVTFRDVVILNSDNEPVAVYNLTEHNLGDDDNYEELKALLIASAE